MPAALAALAILGSAQPGSAQGTERAFCLTAASSTSPQGSIPECRYDTMAQCQQAAGSQSTARCGPNPRFVGRKK
jgi:hypothetical protein